MKPLMPACAALAALATSCTFHVEVSSEPTPESVARAAPPAAPAAPTTPPREEEASVENARTALDRAYDWLAATQLDDGSWPYEAAEDATGPLPRAIGVSALAVLALQESSDHQDAARRGAAWLAAQQNEESGLIGRQVGLDFLYGHGIATLALVRSPQANEERVQAAVDVVLRARNQNGGWRYDLPPAGDNDTSVTGWMLAALDEAREHGYAVDDRAIEGGIAWIDEVTDPATGRVGYDSFGSLSSRTPANASYPRERGEAMTAVGLKSRVELEGAEADRGIVMSHARLIKRKLPEWDTEGLGVDMYYWYHGTRAMRALGGADWEAWRNALLAAVVPNQADDGSWDPVGPWGYAGGRVFATALMAMSLAECVQN